MELRNITLEKGLFSLTCAILLIQSTLIHTAIAGDDCPKVCKCPTDQNNTVVDCSSSALTSLPRFSLQTKKLLLSHNALGPIINDSFPRMGSLVELDLSYNGLTRLLGCTLQGMLGLKRFSLRGNRLTSLPDSLFTDANGLDHLDISHNIMTSLPDHVFRNLPNLKTLDASHNRMVQLQFGLGLQVPRHLQTIDISHNHFETITVDSFHTASGWEPGFQRTLNLANCRLTSVQPSALGKIPGLHDLDLSGNPGLPLDNLTSIVKELETKGLEKLSLSNMNLTSLTPFFAQVTQLSLKLLNVSDNDIENVPADTFSTISSLRVLDISGNKLTSLDAGFSDLRNLKILNISRNALTHFQGDDVLSHLNKLKVLDISHNELSNPANVNFGPLTKLTYLDVSENHLTSVVLPESTDKLKHFDYHSNAITEFSGFDNVPKIEYFDISDNDLKEIEGYLFKQSRFLKLVNFSKNSITKLSTNAFLPQSSLVIDLSDNFITKIQYSNWVATQELYLNDNEIEQLDFQSFHLMNGLRILDLSENKLSHLHDDLLDYTTSLTYLNLSHNEIQQTHFFLVFRNLENLEILDLGNNNITHLNESMLEPIPKLEQFSLSQNHLEIIKPRVFRDLKNVKNIDLSGNPFLCGCENLGFQDWISRTKIDITGLYARNSSSYVCKGPSHRVGKHITDWSPGQFECDKTMLYMIVCGSVGLTLIVAGVVSTVIYRIYKCHKRKKLEEEKARFRKECYGDDYDEDDEDDENDEVDGYRKKKKKKGGKLDLSKMTSEEIAEEITNAIERRERRSMRKAEESKKKNSNGYVPWPPNGNAKLADEKKNGHDKTEIKKPNANNNTNSRGRRESIEARQYDRIIQQQNEEAKMRYAAETGGKRERESRERRSEGERYTSNLEDDILKSRALKVHRSSAPAPQDIMRISQQQLQQQQRWKQQQTGRGGSGHAYLSPEPEPDYGYETEPATRRRDSGGGGGKRYNRWDSLDVWDRDARGWAVQGQHRSRSQGHNRDRYMTLPIREQDYQGRERSRSSRRDNNPRLYLDHYTNEVRFGVENLKQHSSRQSRWDAYNNTQPQRRHHQQLQQHQQQHPYKMRSRSLHQLPLDYGDQSVERPFPRYVGHLEDVNDEENRRYRHQHHQQRLDDDRRPLIGPPPRAVSQPYLVSENTSDWL